MRLLVLVLAVTLTACGLPADPQNTLAEARGNELHVGVAHDPPWAVVEGDEVIGGVEVRLLRRFADTIDADPVFHVDDLDDLAAALEQFELDVLVGGMTTDSAWGSRLAFTPVYTTERVIVAGTKALPPGGLDGATVAYPDDEPQLAARIRSAGGTPVSTPALSPGTGAEHHDLVAVPAWRAQQLGLQASGVQLAERNHAIALPRGENGMLHELATHLHGSEQSVESLLDQEVSE